jgi:acyl-CoA reductase-like NAD-dependent aldehyde dehydrogenase
MSVAEKEKVETFKNFVNGKWTGSRNGATFENENPAFRGSNVGLFQSSTPEDVLEAITVADNAYRTWKRTSVAERQGYIAEFLRLLKENREELARIVTLENEKN